MMPPTYAAAAETDAAAAEAPVDILSRIVLSQWWMPALAVGHRLGIPAALARDDRSPAEVAAAVGAEELATAVLLDMLTALGVCSKDSGRFRLARDLQPFLASEGEMNWGPMLKLAWDERCSRLLESIVSGKPKVFGARGLWACVRDGGQLRETFVSAMHARSVPLAQRLAARIHETFGGHVLDVGAGSGVYAREILRARPKCHVTLLDLPEVGAMAREVVGKAGFAERAESLSGDMFSLKWPRADIVLLSDVLHDWPDRACAELVSRAARSLSADGLLMIHDMHLTDPPSNLTAGANSLSMVAITGGRQRYTREIDAMVRRAGLIATGYFRTSYYYTVVTARKAADIGHE